MSSFGELSPASPQWVAVNNGYWRKSKLLETALFQNGFLYKFAHDISFTRQGLSESGGRFSVVPE